MTKKRKPEPPTTEPARPKVYAYARVSTFRQTGGQSIETQHEQLLLLAQRHGFDAIDEIFTDEEASGGTPIVQRPKGRELCYLVSPGDVVLLTDLDRAFRSTSDALDTLLRWHSVKIRVIIQSIEGWGNLDFSTPIGEFFLTVLVAVKKLERNQRVAFVMQCSRDAIAKHAAEGWDGSSRRHTPMGYQWGFLNRDRGKPILVSVPFDWETAAVIGWLRDRHVAYDKIRDIILPEIGRDKRTRSSRRQVGNVRAGYRRYDVSSFQSTWQWGAMDKAQAWCWEHSDEQEESLKRIASQHPEWANRWGLESYVSRLDGETDCNNGNGLDGGTPLHPETNGTQSSPVSVPGEVDCGTDGDGQPQVEPMARPATLQDEHGSLCDRDRASDAAEPASSQCLSSGDADGGEGRRKGS